MMIKRAVEETAHIDIKDVKQHLGKDVLLTFTWSISGSINIEVREDYIILLYQRGEENIRTRVDIETTKVGYGLRHWLNCPACENRVSKIYKVMGVFACRNCHKLTYMTCRESGNDLHYLSLKIRRLQDQLGMSTEDVTAYPLFKPRYMHQKTFNRLRIKLSIVQRQRDEAWLKLCKY